MFIRTCLLIQYQRLTKILAFQINQKVEKEWPLTLKDNEDQNKKIILKPGEMLLYESAKVPHGRQFPLEGEYYENILVHFGIQGTLIRI